MDHRLLWTRLSMSGSENGVDRQLDSAGSTLESAEPANAEHSDHDRDARPRTGQTQLGKEEPQT